MKVTVWKNDKESTERCITRFNKKVQASRKLVVLRSERYYERKPKKKNIRAKAIMRESYRTQREKNKFY
ncbi:MAG: 30S ribosomal protein S21 [Candidatus Gracilibacteria bacterium]|jgi:ribosomal protein S21